MRASRSKLRGVRGFTLLELLVGVVLVGVLSGLAALGARGALTAADQAKCAGNLKNLGVAFHLYALDHDGKFPETTHTRELQEAWIYTLETYLGNFDETRICPADPKGPERLRARGTSYVLNSYLFVPEIGPFGEVEGPALNRVSAIPEPSRTMMAFICADRTGSGPGNDHTHSVEWTSWAGVCRDVAPDRFGGGAPLRTRGRANYLYVDGRVESMHAAELKQKTEAGINVARPPGIEGLP